MTDNEIQIAIAEVCGWTRWDVCSPIDRKTPIALWQRGSLGAETRCELPDYANDLNAMHEAEKTLSEKLVPFYLTKLLQVRYRNGADSGMIACMADRIAFATARQRAEAFLRTIDKWKE